MDDEEEITTVEEKRLSERLNNRRNGVLQSKGKISDIKKEKSSIYCNKCNVPESLVVCHSCQDNVCKDCLKNRDTCIICYRKKSSRKVVPHDYANKNTYKKYFCCLF